MSIFSRRRDPEPVDDENEIIEGDRDVSSVNRGLSTQAKLTNYVIAIAVMGIAGALLYTYYSNLLKNQEEESAAEKQRQQQFTSAALPPLQPPMFIDRTPPKEKPVAEAPPLPAMQAPSAAAPPAMQQPNGQKQLTPEELRLKRRLESPVLFSMGSNASPMGTPSIAYSGEDLANLRGAGARIGALGGAGEEGPTATDSFVAGMQASRFDTAKATMLENPSLTATMGTAIPCTVQPALDTTLPGIVTCVQKLDVYSTDGKVLLLEKGTKWVGQQRAGLQQGQRRVGIIWARGETPNHVLVDVDSAAADELGRPGITGEIDNHFWERFGGAIMLSLISDVGSYIAATQTSAGNSGGNTNITFPNTVQGSQDVMTEVIRHTIDIPPTLTKNQGADVMIYVARDLDFSDVYMLQAVN